MNTSSLARRPPKRIFALALALFVLALLGALAEPARAAVQKRVALVIGNGDYLYAPKLDNPTVDAKAVAAELRNLGFELTEGYDLSSSGMRALLAQFAASLPDSSAAVVYYAGHGVSVDDENYLLPVDIRLRSPTDLDLNAVSVSLILKQLRREDRVNVVILDACRDNPFAAELARAKTRAAVGERGLSRVDGDLARGSLIAFASDPRSVALDGPPGQHSPFTKALLDHMADPGVSIDTVMSRVRAEVWEGTKNRQLPWVNTSIIGEFDLNPAAPPAAAANAAPASAPNDTENREDILWESAQHSNLSADYKAYLDSYPSGAFAQMAKNRIAALEAPAAATPNRTSSEPEAAKPALETEVADEASERSLNLDLAARKEVQTRLQLLGADPGLLDGEFADRTRQAIRDWQKRHALAPSGWLAPLQYAALKSESEDLYQRFSASRRWAPRPAMMTPIVRRAYHPPTEVRARENNYPPKERRRPVIASPGPATSEQAAASAPPPAPAAPAAQGGGPCQGGFHTVAFPNRQGYRCVQNGF